MAPVDDALALLPTPARAELLAELEAIADQTRAFVDATRAPNSVRAYAADWRDFLNYSDARGLTGATGHLPSILAVNSAVSKRLFVFHRITQVECLDRGTSNPRE